MKHLLLGLATLVAVGYCYGTSRKGIFEEYYGGGRTTDVTSGLTGDRTSERREFLPVGKSKDISGTYGREEDPTFTVKVDRDEIENIVEDFNDFGERYLKKTSRERAELLRKLTLAFRNTAGKLILNFGKTIPPVV